MIFELTDESRMKLHDIRNHLQMAAGRRALKDRIREDLLSAFEEAVGQVQEGRSRDEVARTLRRVQGRFGDFDAHGRAMEAAFDRIVDIIFDTEDRREPQVLALGDLVRNEVTYCHTDLAKLPAERLIFREANLPFVHAPPVRITRLVHNLIYNAAEAVQGGMGGVEVEVDIAGVGVEREGMLGPIPAGSYAVLTVSDEGEGIPEEEVDRVFEAGFTTKDGRGHAGLGMSLVRDVLAECGGNLEVLPREPNGTLVRVYIPAVDPAREDGAAAGCSGAASASVADPDDGGRGG